MCKERGDFVFSNKEIRETCERIGFGNPFNATKIDSSLLLPDAMSAGDAFVVHLGKGNHKFVFGIGAELSKRNLTCELPSTLLQNDKRTPAIDLPKDLAHF